MENVNKKDNNLLNLILKTALSGFLSGIAIGIGGLCYISCLAYIQDLGLGKLFGSLAFTVGLFFICTFGFSLYTGRIGYVIDKEKYKYLKLLVMIIFNCLGTFLMGLACYFICQNDTSMMNAISNVVSGKNNFSADNLLWLKLLIKSIFCGALVFIATYIFKKANSPLFKLIGVILPIVIFVLCGFEHCIANVFYFGFAYNFSTYDLLNFVIVFIGNSIGSILVALAFRYLDTKVNDKNLEENNSKKDE